RERWPEQRGANVAVAVVIAPALVVLVGLFSWCDLVEEALQILHASGFVFDGGDAARRPRDEDACDARPEAAPGDSVGDVAHDVHHVAVALRGDVNAGSVNRHGVFRAW